MTDPQAEKYLPRTNAENFRRVPPVLPDERRLTLADFPRTLAGSNDMHPLEVYPDESQAIRFSRTVVDHANGSKQIIAPDPTLPCTRGPKTKIRRA